MITVCEWESGRRGDRESGRVGDEVKKRMGVGETKGLRDQKTPIFIRLILHFWRFVKI
jgi:hypothetical protein